MLVTVTRVSGREALAAFGAAAVEHGAAASGGHASTEAVGALALQDAGLEGSFHDGISSVDGGQTGATC